MCYIAGTRILVWLIQPITSIFKWLPAKVKKRLCMLDLSSELALSAQCSCHLVMYNPGNIRK